MSATAVYSQEAKKEVEQFFKSKRYYLDPNGDLAFSLSTDTVTLLLKNMTGSPHIS
jgi:hypothetical protein